MTRTFKDDKDDIIMNVARRLLNDAGWTRVELTDCLFRKDGRELVLTPTVAYAIWDTYGVGE